MYTHKAEIWSQLLIFLFASETNHPGLMLKTVKRCFIFVEMPTKFHSKKQFTLSASVKEEATKVSQRKHVTRAL